MRRPVPGVEDRARRALAVQLLHAQRGPRGGVQLVLQHAGRPEQADDARRLRRPEAEVQRQRRLREIAAAGEHVARAGSGRPRAPRRACRRPSCCRSGRGGRRPASALALPPSLRRTSGRRALARDHEVEVAVAVDVARRHPAPPRATATAADGVADVDEPPPAEVAQDAQAPAARDGEVDEAVVVVSRWGRCPCRGRGGASASARRGQPRASRRRRVADAPVCSTSGMRSPSRSATAIPAAAGGRGQRPACGTCRPAG